MHELHVRDQRRGRAIDPRDRAGPDRAVARQRGDAAPARCRGSRAGSSSCCWPARRGRCGGSRRSTSRRRRARRACASCGSFSAVTMTWRFLPQRGVRGGRSRRSAAGRGSLAWRRGAGRPGETLRSSSRRWPRAFPRAARRARSRGPRPTRWGRRDLRRAGVKYGFLAGRRVVDDVEDHAEPELRDRRTRACRPACRVARDGAGEQVDAVVAPARVPANLAIGMTSIVARRARRGMVAVWRPPPTCSAGVNADVQLVEHVLIAGCPSIAAVGPRERVGRDVAKYRPNGPPGWQRHTLTGVDLVAEAELHSARCTSATVGALSSRRAWRRAPRGPSTTSATVATPAPTRARGDDRRHARHRSKLGARDPRTAGAARAAGVTTRSLSVPASAHASRLPPVRRRDARVPAPRPPRRCCPSRRAGRQGDRDRVPSPPIRRRPSRPIPPAQRRPRQGAAREHRRAQADREAGVGRQRQEEQAIAGDRRQACRSTSSSASVKQDEKRETLPGTCSTHAGRVGDEQRRDYLQARGHQGRGVDVLDDAPAALRGRARRAGRVVDQRLRPRRRHAHRHHAALREGRSAGDRRVDRPAAQAGHPAVVAGAAGRRDRPGAKWCR